MKKILKGLAIAVLILAFNSNAHAADNRTDIKNSLFQLSQAVKTGQMESYDDILSQVQSELITLAAEASHDSSAAELLRYALESLSETSELKELREAMGNPSAEELNKASFEQNSLNRISHTIK